MIFIKVEKKYIPDLKWLMALSAVLCCSCMNYSSFQTADVLDKGEETMTVALSHTINDNSEAVSSYETLYLSQRHGLGKNLDCGAGLTLTYPFTFAVSGDVKYQFINKDPFKAAFDLGLSYTGFIFLFDFTATQYLVIQPMLIAEMDEFYFAYRYNIGSIKSKSESMNENGYFSSFYFGLEFGEKIKIMPELALHVSKSAEHPLIVPGLGIIFDLNKNKK